MSLIRNCFTVGLAGYIIEIDSVSPRTCNMCENYLQEGEPDFRIKITEEDVQRELIESSEKRYSESDLENIAVYRQITETLIDYDFVLMHGAVISVGESAYMFCAPSGTGKTTHIRLWLRNVSNSIVVNGDKPFIKIKEEGLIACGTPWSGKERMNTNIMKPLKSIVFMERSESNYIEKITFPQAYPYLIQNSYLPRDAEKARKVIGLLSLFYEKVSFWRFQCNNFKKDCFETTFNALVENNK